MATRRRVEARRVKLFNVSKISLWQLGVKYSVAQLRWAANLEHIEMTKFTAAEMAEKLRNYKPTGVRVETLDEDNVRMSLVDFHDGEPLQFKLNMDSQRFAPLATWTELGGAETDASIAFYLTGATLDLWDETLMVMPLDESKEPYELAAEDVLGLGEQLVNLLGFWYTSPAFRIKQ
jgi:hypothetical protein